MRTEIASLPNTCLDHDKSPLAYNFNNRANPTTAFILYSTYIRVPKCLSLPLTPSRVCLPPGPNGGEQHTLVGEGGGAPITKTR